MTMTTADLQLLQPELDTSKNKYFLNAGCGTSTKQQLPECFRTPDWQQIRLDSNPAVKPDIQADIRDLSIIQDSTVEAIYSSHSLEHLTMHEAKVALKEMLRVLRPQGFLLITLPDIQQVAQWITQGKLMKTIYQSPIGPITPLDILYGHQASITQGNHYMTHKSAFDRKSLANILKDAEFEDIRVTTDKYYNLWAYSRKGG